MSIEPTTSCNLRCPECPSGLRKFSRPTGMLEKELFKRFLDQVRSHLHSLNFYFQGEPYLHPQFTELVKMASLYNIYTITSTNAHYLNEENARRTIESGLDELIISVDGITQEVYERYRVGGQLNKVMEGTRQILNARRAAKGRGPYVVWQFVVFAHNETQVEEVKKLGKELGVDAVRIKTAQVYDFEEGKSIIPSNQKYSRYRKNAEGKYEIKNELLDQCWRMWQGAVVTWDGKVVPCCFDKDAKYSMGELKDRSMAEVWRSAEYDAFRSGILKGRSQIDICRNCTEGTRIFAD
jgi:radical SAM protein with 4Fe4S-binding SPASM domain